jgi:hypothetical protein
MTERQTHPPEFLRARKHTQNQFSASKLYRGKQLTVRMTNPDTSRGVPVSGVPWLLPTASLKVKKLTPITGNYLPAQFEVLGFSCQVSFTLQAVKGARGSSTIEITQLTCEHGVTNKLPLALFRLLALKACTFSAVLVPPFYTYTSPSGSFTYNSGADGAVEIVGSAKLPASQLNDLLDPQQDKASKLKQIWDLYQQAPEGQKYAKVAEGFGYSAGNRAGIEWAHKWVKRARKEFAPHTVRKTKQKRGKK